MDKSINLNIKVGDEDWVKNRFDKKDECKCYLLSGAEFFQVEKTTWNSKDIIQSRMINTEGINDLAELGFNKTILTHLVLAENYKHFPPKNRLRNSQLRIITKKPLVASSEELNINNQSRSAKLRAAELK